RSSSGEIFNKNKMTAAHPSLPFGTHVKVTNLANNQSVVVRITDRGPFSKNRIIDLSEAAARKIGMLQSGVAKVNMEVVSKPGSEVPSPVALADSVISDVYFVIQAGSFSDLKNAEQQSEKIKALQSDLPVVLTQEKVGAKTIHRVLAGRFQDRQQADRIKETLTKAGIPTLVRQGNG
ncbi:MAG TPA: septal ring lytic transglycosylase RlpA family protein, partial [Adhaeribacter sp.]|nr:septal ring lytic transglycosylase RlpA family protein [Adhaeribacter sp.]